MAHGRPMLMGARGVAARSSRTAAALWRGPCGSPSASREMRFSPPDWGTVGRRPGKVAAAGAHPNDAAPGKGAATAVFPVMAVAPVASSVVAGPTTQRDIKV
jgi:hypothetical protein